ncbi:MAG: isocitrate lyase/phosphoenolpyruvate mutase family protein [Acidobacteriota bacterium]
MTESASTPTQPTRAQTFRDLHRDDTPLILPNAWDAGSARLMEHLGCKAVATTSGGVAWTHGYPDGDRLPVPLLATTVASITRVVSVPVSVDIEGGYADDPAVVEDAVAAVIDAGAVGINIEDGSDDPALLCRKIEAARRASERLGVALFINARTDVVLRGLVAEDAWVTEITRRAALYRSAGADGLFVPRLTHADAIAALAAVGMPLNVMACPGLPAVAELQRLGVRRLSAGTSLAQMVYGQVSERAAAFLRDGDSDATTADGMPYADINALFPASVA